MKMSKKYEYAEYTNILKKYLYIHCEYGIIQTDGAVS